MRDTPTDATGTELWHQVEILLHDLDLALVGCRITQMQLQPYDIPWRRLRAILELWVLFLVLQVCSELRYPL